MAHPPINREDNALPEGSEVKNFKLFFILVSSDEELTFL